MVNNIPTGSTRSRILDILKNSAIPVSGEAAANALGISRVAVWKAVRSLVEAGYPIQSSPSGYLLADDDGDRLLPCEFGDEEARFRHWENTDSTMNRAREAALAGAADGLVITAGRQSAGRGTGEKAWESPEGSLLFTLISRPRLDAADIHRQVLAAQCAAVRAIRSVTGRDAIPAWPNDLLVKTDQDHSWGKAGGLLAEAFVSGNAVSFINVGIGINTGSSPAVSGSASISAGRRALLAEFLAETARMTPDSPDLVPLWNSLAPAAGRPVTFIRRGSAGPETGIFRGVDRSGWAVIAPHGDAEDSFGYHFPPGTISIQNKGSIS